MKRDRKTPLWDWIAPLLACLVLIIHCVTISTHKYMWMDEILTYYPASLPRFSDLLLFINDKINCGHYLYFIVIWIWSKIFTSSELSLRLFSSLGFCCGLLVHWRTLRSFYGVIPVTIGVFFAFLCSPVILRQNAEARFDGMLLAISAILLNVTIREWNQRKFNDRTALKLILLNGLLPLTHPFGFLYSLLFTGIVAISDLAQKNPRWWYYSSSFAGWIFFVPFIPAFLRQSELSEPYFWILKPPFQSLVDTVFGDHFLPFLIPIGLVFLLVTFFRRKNKKRLRLRSKIDSSEKGLLFLSAGIFLLPLFVWVESQFFMPLFLPRYFIIIHLGWAILISAAVDRILSAQLIVEPLPRFSLMFSIGFLIIFPLREAFNSRTKHPYAFQNLMDYRPDLPKVLAAAAWRYLPLALYGPNPESATFILDWQSALDDSVENAPQDYEAMEALKRHIPSLHIVQSDEFLAKNSEFVVFEENAWLEKLISSEKYLICPVAKEVHLVRKK